MGFPGRFQIRGRRLLQKRCHIFQPIRSGGSHLGQRHDIEPELLHRRGRLQKLRPLFDKLRAGHCQAERAMQQRIHGPGWRAIHLLVREPEFPKRGFIALIPADRVSLEIGDDVGIRIDRFGAAIISAHGIRTAHIPCVSLKLLRRDFALFAAPDIWLHRNRDPAGSGRLNPDHRRVGIHPKPGLETILSLKNDLSGGGIQGLRKGFSAKRIGRKGDIHPAQAQQASGAVPGIGLGDVGADGAIRLCPDVESDVSIANRHRPGGTC